MTITPAVERALSLHRAGRHVEALDACQAALQAQPADADAMHVIALIAQTLGQQAMALEFLSRALDARPDDATLWNSMGNLARQEGRLDDAERHYRAATARDKSFLIAWVNLGTVCKDGGRLDEALACFRRADRLESDVESRSALYSHWGNALLAQGEGAAAIAKYRKALAFNAANAEASFNLGNALLKTGEGEAAIEAYERAVALQPDFFEPHYQLGIVHKSLKDHEQALGWFQKACALRPHEPMAALKAGDCLYELHRIEEAQTYLRQARSGLADQPLVRLRLETLTPPIVESREAIAALRRQAADALAACEGESMCADEAALLEYNVYPPFYWAFHGEDDLPLRRRFADRMSRLLAESDWTPQIRPEPSGETAPRVGMVVSDGHEIAFNTFVGGFFRQVDPAQLSLTLACSPTSRDRLLALDADLWRGAAHLALPTPFRHKVQTLLDARLDGLFYFEVGTDPVNYLLPLMRLAPVQCASWGFPVTTGAAEVDYFLSSHWIEPPDGASHYRERLVALDVPPVCFRRPPAPSGDKSRAALGLPESGRLYGCLQQLYKFHPDFDAILGEILAKDTSGYLLIMENRSAGMTQALRERLSRTLPPEAMARICWLQPLPTDDFLRVIRHCDVLLDPPHLGGGNTTYEAMAMGVATVTWPGPFMRGRITAGCYARMGVEGPVVEDLSQYAACAVSLAGDPARNQALRARIEAASDVLFDDPKAARELERFFRDALAAWPQGLPATPRLD